MSGWLDRIRQLWRKLWRPKAAALAPAPEPAPPAPAPEPVPIAPPLAPAAPISQARSRELRALERARRRHDKFVKPKGQRPKRERVPRPPRPKLITVSASDDEPVSVGDSVDNNMIIADEWMEGDGQGEVLFREQEFLGEFNFRDSILAQLDRYWVYLERMRKTDFSAYILFSKVGATLVPYAATLSNRLHGQDDEIEDLEKYKKRIALPPSFKRHWPGFGCVAIGTNPLDEAQELRPPDQNNKVLWVIKFMYFYKYERTPWFVQPTRGGHLYRLTIWLDRPHDPRHFRRKSGVPQDYFIWVANDGSTMRALKTRKDGARYRREGDWVLDYDVEPKEREKGYTPQIMLAHRFCAAVRLVEQASYSMCRVEVSKGDLTASFGVDPRRMSYFFRDRDIKLTTDGATKPIFHIVRPHKRFDGTIVPMHFRGLKQFTWADYSVSITVPGRDHFLLSEWDVGVESKPHGRWSREKYLDETQVAEKIKDNIKRGVGSYHQ